MKKFWGSSIKHDDCHWESLILDCFSFALLFSTLSSFQTGLYHIYYSSACFNRFVQIQFICHKIRLYCVWFNYFLVNHRVVCPSPQFNFRTFSHASEIPPEHLQSTPHYHPQSKVVTYLLSVPVYLPFLNILYKCSHTICNLLHLASLT